jgi:hypothetical protein
LWEHPRLDGSYEGARRSIPRGECAGIQRSSGEIQRTRRSFLAVASTVIPTAAAADVVRADFPSHEPALVQEMVVVSHNNFARVQELVGRQPALAKVSFDCGFGDWETPIDAASHTAIVKSPRF